MKRGILPLIGGIVLLALGACAPKPVELSFVDHVKAGLIEQDVYVEKTTGSDEVYGINPDEFDAFKNAPVFATTKVVPDGIYTMWYAFAGRAHMGCKDCPFATVDFPMGEPGGSQSVFEADADGSAEFKLEFSPCLELSGERLMGMLAIAYHSDGNTYSPDPIPFGIGSHVQLFAPLPDKGAK